MNADTRPTIFHLLYHEIMRGDVLLRAPGLAYSTLASMVPIMAIVLAVLSTSAFRDKQEAVFDFLASKLVIAGGSSSADNFSWIPEDDSAATGAYKTMFRDSIKPIAEKLSTISGVGGIVLLVTAYLLFQSIEQAFNSIWRVKSQRPFFIRLAITVCLIVWAPMMLVASATVAHYLDHLNFLGTYVIPLVFTTLLFTGLFMVMPYVRVHFRCALAGGGFAAIIWELTRLFFIIYVTKLVSYSQVYGALGVIPMLLLWLYLNWVVILAGAAFACCLQQRELLEREWQARQKTA
jgi:membrane protein